MHLPHVSRIFWALSAHITNQLQRIPYPRRPYASHLPLLREKPGAEICHRRMSCHSSLPETILLRRHRPVAMQIGGRPFGCHAITFNEDQQGVPVAGRHILHQEHGFEIPWTNQTRQNRRMLEMNHQRHLPLVLCPRFAMARVPKKKAIVAVGIVTWTLEGLRTWREGKLGHHSHMLSEKASLVRWASVLSLGCVGEQAKVLDVRFHAHPEKFASYADPQFLCKTKVYLLPPVEF